ncbi:MAG: SOS response-associated peptidase [Holophagaceae bacterium]|nr:SOS response-associated peptidase [Holophagaceae bacterium]
MKQKADHEARLILDGEYRDRYNLAPTQEAVTIHRADVILAASIRRWGLIPSWAKDPSIGTKLVNARAETVTTKPSFRASFKRSRIVVPVSGFYEWAVIGGRKRAFCILPADDDLWMLAGLSESWQGPDGLVESFTIITTEANAAMAGLHDRMPVILGPGTWQSWLNPEAETDGLQVLLKPCPDSWLKIFEVGPTVGNVRNDGPELIRPLRPS